VNRLDQIRLMAAYNQWMNSRLYEAAASLPDDALHADRKAFFGSIIGTLNHLLVADTIWLQRFAQHPSLHSTLDPLRQWPAPQGLSQLLFEHFSEMREHRVLLDRIIGEWVAALSEADLDIALSYSNTQGTPYVRDFHALLTHFFNHQTHHRGQATTLLSQAGVDVGSTDMLNLIPVL
jgi:uncharacterized damage-inducible protein DinB